MPPMYLWLQMYTNMPTLFLRCGFANFLSELSSNHYPLYVSLPSAQCGLLLPELKHLLFPFLSQVQVLNSWRVLFLLPFHHLPIWVTWNYSLIDDEWINVQHLWIWPLSLLILLMVLHFKPFLYSLPLPTNLLLFPVLLPKLPMIPFWSFKFFPVGLV
jgi:hypothetical protein